MKYPKNALRVTKDLYRVGTCCKCGDCCVGVDIHVALSEEDVLDPKTHPLKIEHPNGIPSRMTPGHYKGRCRYSVKTELGTYKCSIYANRPTRCIDLPNRYTQRRRCTYRFVPTVQLEKELLLLQAKSKKQID